MLRSAAPIGMRKIQVPATGRYLEFDLEIRRFLQVSLFLRSMLRGGDIMLAAMGPVSFRGSHQTGWQTACCGAADRAESVFRQHAALLGAASDGPRRVGVPDEGHLAADQRAVLPSCPRRGVAGGAGDRRAGAVAVVRAGGARRSTWLPTGAGNSDRISCSPAAAAGRWCSGSRHAPASRPARTCGCPPRGRASGIAELDPGGGRA